MGLEHRRTVRPSRLWHRAKSSAAVTIHVAGSRDQYVHYTLGLVRIRDLVHRLRGRTLAYVVREPSAGHRLALFNAA
jgi:hypothetical protein